MLGTNYFVLLFREKETGNIQFIDLSPLIVYIIEQLSLTEKNLEIILNESISIFNIVDKEELYKKVKGIMDDLKHRGFIMEIKKNN